MNGFDLDHPLLVDECMRCSFVGLDCICDPRRPSRQPSAEEIGRARQSRLAEAERQKGSAS